METNEGSDELSEWLSKWNLQHLVKLLKVHGVNTQDDFKYIKQQSQFDKLISALGDGISFMDSCKLDDAWKSMVPNPEKPPPQIHFLGDEEKKILNELNVRFDSLTKDIKYVKNSFEEYKESIKRTKQAVNDNADKMVAIINVKRNELLTKIDSIQQQNKQIYDDKLEQLNKINAMFKNNKQKFNEIAVNVDITASKRLQELNQLLIMSVDGDNHDDDEKKEDNDDRSIDYFKIFAAKCVIPDTISLTFNETSFKNNINSNFVVTSDNKTTEWNLKYNPNIAMNDEFIFDVCGNEKYFDITDNGTVVTGKGCCAYAVVSTKTNFDKGIHKWRIKSVRRRCCYHDIGIITDITRLSEVGISYGNAKELTAVGYCYMLRNRASLVAYYNGTEVEKKNCSKTMKEGDIITLILNCNDWTLTVLLNDENMGLLNIQKNQSYHPFVNTDGCATQQYQLITNKSTVMNASFIFDVYETDYFSIYKCTATGKASCQYSIVSTNKAFNEGIHRWKIKIVKRGHSYLDIGVITDITKLSQISRGSATAAQLKCTGYCYLWYYGTTLAGFNNGQQLEQKNSNIGLQAGDLITVILDCVDWKLSLFKDDEAVGTLNLASNQSYHPMVHSCACNVQQFQLM